MVSRFVGQTAAMPPGDAPTGEVSLVVTDLDGTLWHTDDHIPEVVLEAFAGLADLGVPVLVATGRRLATTLGPLRSHGLEAPAVVLNGALGVLEDGTRFHRSPYPDDEAAAVLGALRDVGIDPVVYVDHPDAEVILGPEPCTNPAHVAALASSAIRGDAMDLVGTATILGFSMIGVDHAVGVSAAASIGALGVTHLDRSLDFPGMVSLTVAPQRRSKWDGVLAYCELEGLDSSRVLALGDGPNDVELLESASLRLVPSGSHPEALRRADHVVDSARDGGWAQVLDHLG